MAKHADTPHGKLSKPSEPETSGLAPNDDEASSKAPNGTEETTPAVGSKAPQAQTDDVVGDKADVPPRTEGNPSQEHADAADQQRNVLSGMDDTSAKDTSSSSAETHGQRDEHEADDRVEDNAETVGKKRLSAGRRVLVAGCAALVALGCLVGWLGYRAYGAHQAQAERNLLVAVATQGAVNLTTIDYTRVDADVRRILDSSAGTFHDDFQSRSQQFIDVVNQAKSKSAGTVTAAGLETRDGDRAEVLVAVTVKTTTAGAPEQDPRRWRMRITVEKVGNGVKVSDVKFVPDEG